MFWSIRTLQTHLDITFFLKQNNSDFSHTFGAFHSPFTAELVTGNLVYFKVIFKVNSRSTFEYTENKALRKSVLGCPFNKCNLLANKRNQECNHSPKMLWSQMIHLYYWVNCLNLMAKDGRKGAGMLLVPFHSQSVGTPVNNVIF